MILYSPMSGVYVDIPDDVVSSYMSGPRQYQNSSQLRPQSQLPQVQQTNNNNVVPSYLPKQEIIRVNGRASIDKLKMQPNTEAILLDATAPIVWLCTSDGLGTVTSTPYDITLHQDAPQQQPQVEPQTDHSLENRISQLESLILEMEEKFNGKSNATTAKSKPNESNTRSN